MGWVVGWEAARTRGRGVGRERMTPWDTESTARTEVDFPMHAHASGLFRWSTSDIPPSQHWWTPESSSSRADGLSDMGLPKPYGRPSWEALRHSKPCGRACEQILPSRPQLVESSSSSLRHPFPLSLQRTHYGTCKAALGDSKQCCNVTVAILRFASNFFVIQSEASFDSVVGVSPGALYVCAFVRTTGIWSLQRDATNGWAGSEYTADVPRIAPPRELSRLCAASFRYQFNRYACVRLFFSSVRGYRQSAK